MMMRSSVFCAQMKWKNDLKIISNIFPRETNNDDDDDASVAKNRSNCIHCMVFELQLVIAAI